MGLGIADDLGGGVEAHGLGIEQGGAEDIRVVAFQPAGGVGDQGEGGRVAFGEAIGAETLQLAEGLLGELLIVAPGDHAADQLVPEMADPAGVLEGGHGAAQLVGLAGGKAGAFNGHPHGLFLEQRHAQSLAQHLLQLGLGKDHGLLALAPAQIGVDHVALDRARAHDRHLDHQVVEGAGLDAGQHGHLRPALDLEDPESVGLADHRVGARILGGDGGEVQVDSFVDLQQVQTALHAAHHAERQAVDLHELQGVDVVFVPLDHLAVLHRRRLDRHQFVEPVARQDEAARVLGQMARGTHQLAGEIEREAQPAVAEVEVQLLGVLVLDPLRPAPGLGRQHLGQVLGQAQGLAHVADRPTGPISHYGGAEGGVVAAVGLVDPLHHDLAPLVLEVHVDVRRLAPLFGDEALKQQVVALGIDGGDAQDVADGGIGGRAAALTEDVLAAGEADDGVHGQEVWGVFQGLDQPQLVAQDRLDLVWHALRIAPFRALPGQGLEGRLGRHA